MIIAVDYDGTVVKHKYPLVGDDCPYAVDVLKELIAHGHQLILWTMRSGKELEDAINWYKEKNITLYGINNNPQQHEWTSSLKAYAQLYIDDASLNAPLTTDLEGNIHIDWVFVKNHLKKLGIIK